ncbi:retrovirus-related pol polyprotein from transposon TNT 1-94 [Tanacetum coccineum]|uniref:Retrovirus-related pol polyprotein from transposon TNT 1-94 n=1 Tax=Tanacetum coccineum TaxID=301880 RepID=A0ABQ4ZKM0_9ASTR
MSQLTPQILKGTLGKIPKAVLMRSGLVSLTTARPVNTAQTQNKTVNSARPMTNDVNTIKDKNVNTARPKAVVNTAKPKAVVNAVQGNQDQGVIGSGCSRHMTGNMSYLTDFEEINGGYVAFGGNPKGGKITSRGVARTPQQKGVAERKNRTLIEPARTMLADSKLPTTFWAKAVNTACYVQNKADEGFFVGYSINSKAFRVFNSRTRIIEENLHVQFSENTPNIAGSRPNWLFDIDALTKHVMMQSSHDAGFKPLGDNEKKVTKEPGKEGGDSNYDQEKEDDNVNNTNNVNTTSDGKNHNNVNVVSSTVNAAGIKVNVVGAKTNIEIQVIQLWPVCKILIISSETELLVQRADME